MKKYPKSIKSSIDINQLSDLVDELHDKLDAITEHNDEFNESEIELIAKELDEFNRKLRLSFKLFDKSSIIGSSEPDATYVNRRNPNKFIETKKYKDGHQVARQYMKWDTPDGEVKNYTGAKDAKRGRYFRTRKDTLESMLEDYDEVESAIDLNDCYWTDFEEPFDNAGFEYMYLCYKGSDKEIGCIRVIHHGRYADEYDAFKIEEGDLVNLNPNSNIYSLEKAQSLVEESI